MSLGNWKPTAIWHLPTQAYCWNGLQYLLAE